MQNDELDTDSKKVRLSNLAHKELARRSLETHKSMSELADTAILNSLDISRNYFIVEGAALMRQFQLIEFLGQQMVNSNLALCEVIASGQAGAVKALLAAGAEARVMSGKSLQSLEAANEGETKK